MVPYKNIVYSSFASSESKIAIKMVKLLNDKKDTRLTQRVCTRISRFNYYCNQIITSNINDKQLKDHLIALLFKENKEYIHNSNYEENIKTHLLCLLNSIHRTKIKQIK